MLNEITYGDHKLVVIYGDSGYMRAYMKFMSLYYNQNCDVDVDQDIIDYYLREDLGERSNIDEELVVLNSIVTGMKFSAPGEHSAHVECSI